MAFTEDEQIEKLWNEYYPRLKAAVRQRVRALHRPVANESEVALSAFRTFLRRAQEGQFPELADDDQLWRLLKTIAIRKTTDLGKHLRAKKRGGDQAILNQRDLQQQSSGQYAGIDAAPGNEPLPHAEIEMSEVFNTLLESLPDDRHRDLILLKLQGAPIAIIAEHLSTTTRTVQRLTKKIEEEWQTKFLQS